MMEHSRFTVILCLGIAHACAADGFFQCKFCYHSIGILVFGDHTHQITSKGLQRTGRQRQNYRKNIAPPKQIQTTAILAGFCTVLSGSILIQRAGITAAAGISFPMMPVKTAAVRWIGATLIFALVVVISRKCCKNVSTPKLVSAEPKNTGVKSPA